MHKIRNVLTDYTQSNQIVRQEYFLIAPTVLKQTGSNQNVLPENQ